MLKASIDSRELEKKLKELSKQLNKEADQSIVEMAQIGGRQLAIRMEPYGITSKAEEISKKAIYKDINNAYDYVGQTFNTIKKQNKGLAYAYAAAVHANNLVEAEKIARKVINNYSMSESDNGMHLNKARNYKGRVPDDNIDIMGIKNNSEIDKIKKEKEVSAGLAKAAWLSAVKDISGKARIPAWLRKSKNYGSGKIDRNGWNTTVTLHNMVQYVSHLLNPSKINAALKNAYTNQIKKLEKQLDAMAKKF